VDLIGRDTTFDFLPTTHQLIPFIVAQVLNTREDTINIIGVPFSLFVRGDCLGIGTRLKLFGVDRFLLVDTTRLAFVCRP
jgi:hypothetical protein